MSLPAIVYGIRMLLNLTLSEKPQWVQARKEMEESWKENIQLPFMVGYNATPEQKAHWKAERDKHKNRYGWMHVVFVLSALFFLFALMRLLWSIPALSGGN